MTLTYKQKKVLALIDAFVRENGASPLMKQINPCISTASMYVRRLEERGMIIRHGKSRKHKAIEITAKGRKALGYPTVESGLKHLILTIQNDPKTNLGLIRPEDEALAKSALLFTKQSPKKDGRDR